MGSTFIGLLCTLYNYMMVYMNNFGDEFYILIKIFMIV